MIPLDVIEGPPLAEPAVHELIRRRWSPRDFSERPIEPEKLRSLFEAARWAPSSFNEQPWSFIVARRENPAEFERLLSTLTERNAQWARQAPVLILSVAKTNFAHTGRPNRHAFHDVGQAAAYLTLQATALGLYVHQMAGFDIERARQLFAIPSGYEPVAAMAVGYLGEAAASPPLRTRRALAEFVFSARGAGLGQP